MSAIFATSIMAARESEGHSRNVSRRRFEVTTVRGPGGMRECLLGVALDQTLYEGRLCRHRGPTTATTIGGASREAVDLRNMQPFLFDVAGPYRCLCQPARIGDRKGLDISLAALWFLLLFGSPGEGDWLRLHGPRASSPTCGLMTFFT